MDTTTAGNSDNTARVHKIAIAIAVLTLAVSLSFVSAQIVEFRDVGFKFDEALQSYSGIFILWDLKNLSISGLFHDTLIQKFYPFFSSWLLAPVMGIFGTEIVVARTFSLVFFITSIILLLLIFKILLPDDRAAPWVFILLPLTSGHLLIFSGLAMLEIKGVALILLFIYFYFKALENNSTRYFILAGITAGLVFLTKYHYGIHLLTALLAATIHYRYSKGEEKKMPAGKYLWLPAVIIVLIWLVLPDNLALFIRYSFSQTTEAKMLSLDNILFYPISFFTSYHSGRFIGLAVLILAGFGLKRLKDNRVFFLTIYILSGLLILTIKLENSDRYFATTVPAFWILAVFGWKELRPSLQNLAGSSLIIISGVLIISFIAGSILTFKHLPKDYGDQMEAGRDIAEVYDFINQELDHEDAKYILAGYLKQVNIPNMRWHLARYAFKNNKRPIHNSYEQVVSVYAEWDEFEADYLILTDFSPVSGFSAAFWMDLNSMCDLVAEKSFNLKDQPPGEPEGLLKVSIWKFKR